MVDGNPANHAMINATLCANPKFADRVIVKYALLGPPESIGQVCGINLAPQAGGNGHVVCGDEMKADRAKGIAMDYMPLRTLQTVLDEVGVLDYQAFKMDVEGYGVDAVLKVGNLLFDPFINLALNDCHDKIGKLVSLFHWVLSPWIHLLLQLGSNPWLQPLEGEGDPTYCVDSPNPSTRPSRRAYETS